MPKEESKSKKAPKTKPVVKNESSSSEEEAPKEVKAQAEPSPVMDLDDLLGMGTSVQPSNNGLLDVDLGGAVGPSFGFDDSGDEDGGDGWADINLFGNQKPAPLDFAKGPLVEVFSAAQAGKSGKTGI